MCVIFSASTQLGSPVHTSRIIRPFLLWLNPHMSEQTIERVHHFIRKTAHAVEYAILGVLIWRVVYTAANLAGIQPARQLRLAMLVAALYAATDETHQIFVPTRQPAVTDVMLDTCGAAAGLAIAWGLLGMRQSR